MNNIIAGVDLAKNIMHTAVLDEAGQVIKKFKSNRESFLKSISELPKQIIIAMEACGGANYWSQEIMKLGYEVKIVKTKNAKIYANSRLTMQLRLLKRHVTLN